MISSEVNGPSNNKHMVQYGVWPDCTNDCDFCLRLNRKSYSTEEKIKWLNIIRNNIETIDWQNNFAYGVSLLGGELYYIKDPRIQQAFYALIDTIIEKVLKPCPEARFSTVTNGMYDPSFLYSVVDKIKDAVGIQRVDVNFSYDIKYRYKNEKSRLLALKNINEFRSRYNYKVGVQMILTQNIINLWKQGRFTVRQFVDDHFPGCILSFLYPHKVNTGRVLDDFFFARSDFLQFLNYLKNEEYEVYINFINSCKNSSTFKYTGLRDRISEFSETDMHHQIPILSDGKEQILEKCGHSVLYQCYSDSSRCMMCDIEVVDSDI